MATTLQSTPNELSLCDDPMEFHVTAPGSFQSAGTKAQLIITISGNPTTNDTFDIEFNGITQTFTCVASPDGSGRQFRNNALGDPLTDYADNVIDDLKKNYYLKTYFEITKGLDGSDPTVEITAKYYGDEYTLTFTDNITNFAQSGNTAGVSRVLNDNHKVLMNLLIESVYKSGNYDELVQLYGSIYESEESTSASGSSYATFDVGEFLKAYFTYPLPSLSLSAPVEINENIIRFKVEHAEQYGATAVPYEITSPSDVYYALNGGTKHPFRFNYPDIEANWLVNDKWLTWQPDNKVLGATQSDYLWFLSLASQQAYFFIKFWYTDGTTNSYNSLNNIALEEYDVLCVPVGYAQVVEPNASPTKTVLKWKIKLTSDSGGSAVIAEEKTFYLDQNQSYDQRVVEYYNSWGVLESMLFDWVGAEGMAVDSFEYEGGVKPVEAATDHRANTQPLYDDDSIVLQRRFTSSDEIEHIKELFFSPKIYLIQDGERLPYYLTGRSQVKSSKGEAGQSVTITLKPSIKNKHYSS